jgi:hypothetical protein
VPQGVSAEEECIIDATFLMAKGRGAEIGATKRGKGMKIMAIVDRHDYRSRSARMRRTITKSVWCSLCFDFYMIEAKLENLIGLRKKLAAAIKLWSWRVRQLSGQTTNKSQSKQVRRMGQGQAQR